MNEDTIQGIITEIERYSIHDGRGIRSTIFLKGCPLRCRWCSNPETQLFNSELSYTKDKCNNCGRCRKVCTLIQNNKDGSPLFPRLSCPIEFACTKACFYGAIRKTGEMRSVKSVVEEAVRDVAFYDATGGGVTISGGEPMAQPQFTIALLKALKRLYIDTAMESCGAAALQSFDEATDYLDTLFLDIKSLNPSRFFEWTSYPLESILENIKHISQMAKTKQFLLILRIPLIPSFNCDERSMGDIARFIQGLPYFSGVEFLAYHKLGRGKYPLLGREYTLSDLAPPTEDTLRNMRNIMQKHDIPLVAY